MVDASKPSSKSSPRFEKLAGMGHDSRDITLSSPILNSPFTAYIPVFGML
jgi:hypothetical protein